jgi:hypothetical protein
MVVIETKSQILEMSAHEMALGPNNNLNYSIKSRQNLINQFHCTQSVEDTLQMTSYINEGYMKLKPLLYPCTIEFSLMCLTVRFVYNKLAFKTFMFSYFFLYGKILEKHFLIKCRIKLQLKMFLWLIVMHQ